jgi:hypothetical protein
MNLFLRTFQFSISIRRDRSSFLSRTTGTLSLSCGDFAYIYHAQGQVTFDLLLTVKASPILNKIGFR